MSARIKTTIDVEGYWKHHFNGHKEYLRHLLKICEIHTVKNSDYTGGQEGDDPLANFRGVEELGVDAGVGIAIRMMDKFQRVKSFVKNGKLEVVNEGLEDALHDIANYCLLWCALRDETAHAGKEIKDVPLSRS